MKKGPGQPDPNPHVAPIGAAVVLVLLLALFAYSVWLYIDLWAQIALGVEQHFRVLR